MSLSPQENFASPEGELQTIDRHFCTLAELRDRLRAGDVWVRGSRQYRDFETYLIPTEAFRALQTEPLPLDIAIDLPEYMAERRQCLQAKMDEVASKARKNELVDVSLADDVLRISPLKKATPPSAVAFAEKVYSLMPHVKITEVLGEVDGWTRLAERFVHMRTLAPPSIGKLCSRPCSPTASIWVSRAWRRPAGQHPGGS